MKNVNVCIELKGEQASGKTILINDIIHHLKNSQPELSIEVDNESHTIKIGGKMNVKVGYGEIDTAPRFKKFREED